jgi:hypothetical protein
MVPAIFAGCCLISVGSILHFRAEGVSLKSLPVKIVLIPLDSSMLSRDMWAACNDIILRFSGVRSDKATTMVHSIYADLNGQAILIGQLNYFGANQLRGAGRSISFAIDKKEYGLPAGIGYDIPFVLEIVSGMTDLGFVNPSFAEVTAWCS